MNAGLPKMTFHVESRRVDAHASVSRCKNAQISLDTDTAGNPDAFNPAELLLAALSACMIKGIERVAPILKFEMHGVEVIVDGVRQDVPPKMGPSATRSSSILTSPTSVSRCCIRT